jgi:hypothetical protein
LTTKSKSGKSGAIKQRKLPTSDEVSDELYESQLRDEARPFMPAAVEELADLAANAPAAVRRQAANDLINHGRIQPKLDTSALEVVDRYVINIMNFEKIDKPELTGGVPVQPVPTVPKELADVIDIEPGHKPDPLLEVSIKDFSD